MGKCENGSNLVAINKLVCDADDLREILEAAYEAISEIRTDDAETAMRWINRAFSLVWVGRNVAADLSRRADAIACGKTP